jgi:predicted amidohydrolase YtcJ
MILDNGVIRTLDPQLPLSRALAIAGDSVAGGVGVHETALASPERINLGGRTVIPGFCDAHVHFPGWALARKELRLEGARTQAEALERVRSAVASVPGGGWVRGRGWRVGEWSDAHAPTKQALDAVAPNTPVALESRDGHSLWLNSAALAGANAPEADGVLHEEAAWAFRAAHLAASEDETVTAMREALRVAASRGVTAVHDKDGHRAVPLWQRLHAQQSLTLRVWQSLPADRLSTLAALDLRAGLGDDWLRIGYVKAFLDGALGSGTAHLLDGSGIELMTTAELEDVVRQAAALDFPVAVHAIGDAANRSALDAFEATRAVWHARRLRPRIEHAQLLAPEDVPRFAELGVAASVQFSHAPADRTLAERAWPDRLAGAYAYRSLWDSGAIVVNGSDAPVEELAPLAGIRAAVLRDWLPEQALTVEEALLASTVHAAWLTGEERRRGTLIPGHLADLVVLDRDPLTIPPEELPEVQVVATMAGGRWVWNPPPWD